MQMIKQQHFKTVHCTDPSAGSFGTTSVPIAGAATCSSAFPTFPQWQAALKSCYCTGTLVSTKRTAQIVNIFQSAVKTQIILRNSARHDWRWLCGVTGDERRSGAYSAGRKGGEIIYTNKTKSIITLVVKQRQEQACNFLGNNLIPSVE